jgi:hypothetical protein
MPTLAVILASVDARLLGLMAAIEARQASYAAAHGGRAWQGLKTHATHPSEGNAAPPTIGMASPADQPGEPWPAAVRNGNKEMALQCDAYRGPQGDGYQIVVFVDVLGVTYSRVLNVGPETWREQAWAAVVPGPV